MNTCENPCYPNWPWRYSRNKHLTRFEPWYTRVEQWPPHYRNSGVPQSFRLQSTFGAETTACDRPVQETKPLHSCRDIGSVGFPTAQRETGSGNAALGLTRGPPPPRIYLKGPSGLEVDNPMRCPVFDRTTDQSSKFLPGICPGHKYSISFDAIDIWRERHKMHLKGHAMEKRWPVYRERAIDRCSRNFF